MLTLQWRVPLGASEAVGEEIKRPRYRPVFKKSKQRIEINLAMIEVRLKEIWSSKFLIESHNK